MKVQRKTTALLVLTVFVLSLVSVAGCGIGGLGGNGDTAWNYQQVIKSPIKATSSTSPVTMGKLDTEKVQVSIPGKTFDKSTPITIVNPDKVPKVVGKEVTPLGAPIEITAGDSAGSRLNEPVTITMKIDKAALKSQDPGQIYATYFNGENWDYIKPDQVDLEAGTLTFTTYHFSLFGYGEISVDERLKKWTQNEALTSWAQGAVNSKFDEAAGKVIDHILTEKLGIEDESMKMKVLGSLLKDGEWGDIRKNIEGAYADGTSVDQVSDLNEKINLLACKKIVEIVPESKLSGALGAITDDFGVGTVKAASQAAGALAAGNKMEAVRIMGEHLSDQFIATTAIKISAAAVQLQIDSWRNAEVEAAYQVYKNGASSKIPFWGYNVQKEEFNDVWDQMKGVSRQLCIEAIAAQEKVRREAGYPPLTEKEQDNIRALVKKDLEKQFKQRLKDDKEVAAEQEKLKELVGKYKEAELLDATKGGPDAQYSLEQRLDQLMHLKSKILKDTKRKGLTDGANSNKVNVSYADLMALTRAWYTQPDGPQKYAQMVKDKFGIDLFPPAADLNGAWQGTFTITNVNIPQGSKAPAGCDLQSMVNKPRPTQYTINLNNSGAGTLTMAGFGGPQPVTLPVNYSAGTLSGSMSRDGGTMTIKGRASQGINELSIGGTGTGSGGGISLSFSWSAKKAMPAPQPTTKKTSPAKK
ncbi:MAG: hypothetical protein GXY34_05035 [Syntrophomonadaceae bacterium]|nr:hypothetical protein [Syntrophomonadaceae bacterium]